VSFCKNIRYRLAIFYERDFRKAQHDEGIKALGAVMRAHELIFLMYLNGLLNN
jgi:hypothetical protein